MSKYNEDVMKLMKVIKEKNWIFPRKLPHKLKFGLYFDWFETNIGEEFNQMPAMVHYNPDILDQYKKRIVWSGFAPTDPRSSTYALHTLVQVRKNFHIIFLFAYEEQEVSVISTLYVTDIEDYLEFVEQNEKYIIEAKEVGLRPGFGGIPMHIEE